MQWSGKLFRSNVRHSTLFYRTKGSETIPAKCTGENWSNGFNTIAFITKSTKENWSNGVEAIPKSLKSFSRIHEQKKRSDLVAALKICSSLRDLERGKRIHDQAMETGLDRDIYVATALIDMYAKCRSTSDARRAFDRMSRRDVFSWNSLMLGYASNGDDELALDLYAAMKTSQASCVPNPRTFVAALMACCSLAEKEEGKVVDGQLIKLESLSRGTALHSDARSAGCDFHTFVANSLLEMYARCGSLSRAREVFEGMASRSAVSWTVLVLGYVEHGESELALEIFESMVAEGSCVADSRTYVAALTACSSLAAKERETRSKRKVGEELERKVEEIHRQASMAGRDSDLFVATAIIETSAKMARMDRAREIFDRMREHDVVAWNALILGYAENGQPELALELFLAVEDGGDARTVVAALAACSNRAALELGERQGARVVKPTSLERARAIRAVAVRKGLDSQLFVGNALVSALAKSGGIDDARQAFDRIAHRDVVSWTAIVLGYAENGQPELALEIFARIECEPNALTLAAAITASGLLAEERTARHLRARAYRAAIETHPAVIVAVLEALFRCGQMCDARYAFESTVVPRGASGVLVWNALLGGYSRHGDSASVFATLSAMRDEGMGIWQENSATFLAILSACSHAGLVEQGLEYFHAMERDFCVTPGMEHYHCVVDLLCRAGRFERALDVIQQMPFAGTCVTWMTVLGACHKWKNVRFGKIAFEKVMELGPGDDDPASATACVLMGNIYASHGMREEDADVMANIKS